MGIPLSEEVLALLRDEQSLKILATAGADGAPHAVVKQTLTLGDDGHIRYLELLESSRTNANLVRAIWSGGRVSVTVARGKVSWQVKGRPVKALVAGPEFQREYVRIRERLGDVDLAAVWLIEPEEAIDETWSVRREEEESAHPYFLHLDRIRRVPAQGEGPGGEA